MKSGWERAVEWYKESEIVASVAHDLIGRRRVPADVRGREFGEWLTNEYRLAMAKGFQMATDDQNDRIAQLEAEVANLRRYKADYLCLSAEETEEYMRTGINPKTPV